MTSDESFSPDWTSAPSDTILEILADRGISSAELAAELGQTMDAVQALLDGRSAITLGTARSLSVFLGGSVQFWMTRDLQYRNDVVKLTKANRDWLAQLPVGDMIRLGWLGAIPHPAKELEACLEFFGVSSVPDWYRAYEGLAEDIAFRTSRSFDSRPGAVAAWATAGGAAKHAERVLVLESGEVYGFTAGTSSADQDKGPRHFRSEAATSMCGKRRGGVCSTGARWM